VLLCGPTVHEKANRREDRAREHDRDAELGLRLAVVGVFQVAEDDVDQRAGGESAEDLGGAQSDVMEIADVDGLILLGCIEGGEGGEDEVEDAVVEDGEACLDLDNGMEC
jgi:hypothetical protein